MISTLSDSKTWIAREHDRPAGIEIRLLRRTLVLPWSHFLYAEGDGDRISVTNATHDISIYGVGFSSLLSALSDQHVSLLREPVRAERFSSDSGARITSISIQKIV